MLLIVQEGQEENETVSMASITCLTIEDYRRGLGHFLKQTGFGKWFYLMM